jgi:hypothetical protein
MEPYAVIVAVAGSDEMNEPELPCPDPSVGSDPELPAESPELLP